MADQETFDYRLGSLSPAVLFGDVSARNATSTYRLVCDVNGDKLQIKDGKMTVGAVHGGTPVTGGTLAVWLGETLVGEFTALPGPQGVKLESTEANTAFRLAFTPSDADGYAEIARLKGLSGMLLLVR